MRITVGYKIVIFFFFSHECEIWSLVLRGENMLRMNKKMGSSSIFVLRREKVRWV